MGTEMKNNRASLQAGEVTTTIKRVGGTPCDNALVETGNAARAVLHIEDALEESLRCGKPDVELLEKNLAQAIETHKTAQARLRVLLKAAGKWSGLDQVGMKRPVLDVRDDTSKAEDRARVESLWGRHDLGKKSKKFS